MSPEPRAVKHRFYGAEVLMIAGVIVGLGSPMAFRLGLIWIVRQIDRAEYDEGVLRKLFRESIGIHRVSLC